MLSAESRLPQTVPFSDDDDDSETLDRWEPCAGLLLETTSGPGLWPNEGMVFSVFTSLATSLLFSPVTPGLFTVTKLAILTANRRDNGEKKFRNTGFDIPGKTSHLSCPTS